jgi:carboxyl-terminal processing protease
MSKKINVVGITILVFFTLTGLALSQIDQKIKDDLYSQIELYSYTLTTIQADYVEELKPKDLIYGSLKGMLATLDPHSQFLDSEEYKDLKTETEGKFGGLGIEISIRDGLLTIITPLEDTPAWKAGIKAGDRIVKIEDELTKDITLSEAVKKLRGKPKTDINITILREKEFKILEFTITREIIHIEDVKHVQILADHVGYIRLTEFREDSAKAFREALDDLGKQGADSLILDLRNNPGGLLNVAIQITEEFLPQGEIIVSTKGRRSSQNSITKSTNRNHLIGWPMVILINEGSASGSEILAGALKDNKRAIILGTKSFGKGSVQSVIPLPDGSGLRLTTSKYFTPSGESIHGIGIEPDIKVEYVAVEEKSEDTNGDKIKEIFENIEMEETDNKEELKLSKIELEARTKLLEDNQVQSAISVLKGIRVFKKFGEPAEPSGQSNVSL